MSINASILIPVYNGVKYIDSCCSSLINSNELLESEIIFIDDGSIDNSLEKINLFKDANKSHNIIVLKNEKNRGLSFSLNKGIKAALGNYIFRLDIDDCWVDGRLNSSLKYFKRLNKINENYALLGTFMKGKSGKKYISPIQVSNLYQLIFTSCVFHPTWCIKSSIAKKYTYEMESPFDDYYFILRLILDNYQMFNIPEYLVIYNDNYTKDRITVRSSSSRNVNFVIIKFLIIKFIIKRILFNYKKHFCKKNLLKQIRKIIITKAEFKSNFFLSKISQIINTILYKIYFCVLYLCNYYYYRKILKENDNEWK